MLNVAQKHTVAFEAISLSEKHKLSLPAFYHVGYQGSPRTMNCPTAKCLRRIHKITTVEEMRALTLEAETKEHRPTNRCTCSFCRTARGEGCKNPANCLAVAERILQGLGAKFNPDEPDDVTIRPEEYSRNQKLEEGIEIKFDKTTHAEGPLSDNIRVF
ncbi:hypothetical protein DL93DRAFT_2029122, partial [Clavulina sp. PMI_390]